MKIDILIPTFNGEKYICQQIDSILNQSFNNFNIIIKDDKSTDSTFELICAKYSHIKNMVLLSSDSNVGYNQNFIDLMTYSGADIVLLSDQDDIWQPNKISTILNHPNINDKYFLVANDARIIDANSNLVSNTYAGKYIRSESIYRLTHCNYTQGCSMAFNKNIKDLFLLYRTPIPYDWHINFIATALESKHYIDEQLHDYRRHENNLTNILSVDNEDNSNLYRVADIIYSAPTIHTFISLLNIINESIGGSLPNNTAQALEIFNEISNNEKAILNNLTIEDAAQEILATEHTQIVNFYKNFLTKIK